MSGKIPHKLSCVANVCDLPHDKVLNYSKMQNKKTSSPWLVFFSKHFPSILTAAELFADSVTIFVSFLAGHHLFSLLYPDSSLDYASYIKFALIALVVSILVFEKMGLYKKQMSLMNINEIRKIIWSNLIIFLLLFAYSTYSEQNYSWHLLFFSFLIMFFLTLTERMIFFKIEQLLNVRGVTIKRVLIFGAGEVGRMLYQNLMQSPKFGYRTIGFFDENVNMLASAKEWFKVGKPQNLSFLSDINLLQELIITKQIDEIFIARPSLSPESQEEIIIMCKQLGVKVNYIPYLFGHFVEHVTTYDICGIPVLSSTEKIPAKKAGQFNKNIFDYGLSLVLMPIILPLIGAIAFFVKKDSPGPIFFRQSRVGKNGKLFTIYKFRTMYVDAPVYKNSPQDSQDPRITPFGRFLRKTSLDELPQLFNVLKGEMSLVGPRPEMPFIVNQYNELQRERLRVKPGITGVWQISADREREIHENISYDLFYVKNCSLTLDIVIIARTVLFSVFSMKTY